MVSVPFDLEHDDCCGGVLDVYYVHTPALPQSLARFHHFTSDTRTHREMPRMHCIQIDTRISLSIHRSQLMAVAWGRLEMRVHGHVIGGGARVAHSFVQTRMTRAFSLVGDR